MSVAQDAAAQVQTKVFKITRTFLEELGRERAINAISLNASLQEDLGIDSLGKVELFHRIEESFGIRLPESAMIQSDTLGALINVILEVHNFPLGHLEKKAPLLESVLYTPEHADSLVEVLLHRAQSEPKRPHIYLPDEKGEEKVISYGNLFTQATKIANGLRDLGIEQGNTVAIMLPTCEEFFYTFFGILLVGAIPVPIYPPFRPDRIEEYAMRAANILRNAEARLLITFDKAERLSELLKVFISHLKQVTTVKALKKEEENYIHVPVKGDMPALIQYTSGSTSAPKGVLLSHTNLLANIRAIGKAIQITPTDVGVSWLPLYHDMGLIGSWLMSFYHANPIVILSPFTFLTRPEQWLWNIHYYRATLSGAPNFAYELCMRRISPAAIEGLDLSSWRLCFNGAEAVNPKTIQSFIKKFSPYGFRPQTMYPVYGLAESSVALAFPPLNREPIIDHVDREVFQKEQKAIPTTDLTQSLAFVACGKPIPDHAIRVVDEKGSEVAERQVGRVQFKGPSSMMGYYRQPEATAAIFQDGWWDTGDLGYLVAGEIYITGRKKDTIIKAGRNFYPEEIEEITSQISGIRKGCVVAFGILDTKWATEKLIIAAETNEEKATFTKISSEIREKVNTVLGIVPDEVILVPPRTIPKTSSGKLQRSACKEAYVNKKLLAAPTPMWAQITKLYLKGLALKVWYGLSLAMKVIYTGYVGVIALCSVPLLWASAWVLPSKWVAKILKGWANTSLLCVGVPITVIHKENLSSARPVVFVANHASYLDSIVLLAVLPSDVQFVGKKELLEVPFLSTILKKMHAIMVDRFDFTQSIADSEKITTQLHQKKPIVVFPEGTFSASPGLRPFKLGAFKVAVNTASPLCPVAIQGTRSIWRGDKFLLRPKRVKVTIGNLILPQTQEWDEVVRLHHVARAMIAEHCGEQVINY